MRTILLTVVSALLASVALAEEPSETPVVDRGNDIDNPYEYETNTTWTEPPIEGFRELYVEPAAFLRSLAPASPPVLPSVDAPAPEGGGMPVTEAPDGSGPPPKVSEQPLPRPGPMVPPEGNLVLVNNSSGWAEVSINGTKVGMMGPLARATIHGLDSGGYDVEMLLSSGYTWEGTVQTCGPCIAEEWAPGAW